MTDVEKRVASSFPFHIDQMIPASYGWVLTTDRGRKRLERWRDPTVLKWSFQWREAVVAEGFRPIERFIRTQSGAPYVWQGGIGYTAVDDRVGDTLDGFELDQCEEAGRILGWLHRPALPFSGDPSLYWRRMIDRDSAFLKEMGRSADRPWMIEANIPAIRQRLEWCRHWLTQERSPGFAPLLTVKNMIQTPEGWYIGGCHEKEIVWDVQALVFFLNHMIRSGATTPDHMVSILRGYADRYGFDETKRRNVCALWTYPLPLMRWLRRNQDRSRTVFERNVQSLLGEQKRRETLVRQVASRLEKPLVRGWT